MSIWFWLAALVVASYSFLQLGRRIERGKLEIDLAEREKTNQKRAGRPGSIQLSTVKLRR